MISHTKIEKGEKMMKTIFFVFSLLVAVNCNELSILSSPKSVEFKGNSALSSDILSDVFGAALGYSVERKTNWDGLYVNNPFDTARGVIAVVVEGLDKVELDATNNYELSGPSAITAIEELLEQANDHNDVAFEVNFKSDSRDTPIGVLTSSSDDKSLHYLKLKNKEDQDIVNQIALLNSLAELLTESENLPAVIVPVISFEALTAAHSSSSPAVNEALKMFADALDNLKSAANKAYGDRAVVAVVTADTTIYRTKRQATDIPETLNIAKDYSPNYPVIFNIILWFSVVMVFTLLAISMAIGGMDPGRDSIIYRMTSTRMKKDN